MLGATQAALLGVAGGGGVPWTPAAITTRLWLDAADTGTITQSGGAVSQWLDKSGNSYTFTAAGAVQPTTGASSLNSRNVIDFAADYLTATVTNAYKFLIDGTEYVAAMVVKIGVSSDPNSYMALMGNGGQSSIYTGMMLRFEDYAPDGANNGLDFSISRGTAGQYVTLIYPNNVCSPNTYHVLSLFASPGNATAAQRIKMWVDAGSTLAGNGYSAAPSTSNPSYPLQIGAAGPGSFAFTGGYGEIVITSSAIADSDRQKLEGYLAHKWGLTGNLPANHPYKSAAPTV